MILTKSIMEYRIDYYSNMDVGVGVQYEFYIYIKYFNILLTSVFNCH